MAALKLLTIKCPLIPCLKGYINYLFLGYYVDQGHRGWKTMALLLALKIKRFLQLLIVKDTVMDIPFMDIPTAPKVRKMLSFRGLWTSSLGCAVISGAYMLFRDCLVGLSFSYANTSSNFLRNGY